VKISVKVLLDGTIKALGQLEKQTRAATMIALTKTAKHAQTMMYAEFKAKLDRPTPTVMKSLFVQPATREKLAARVFVKDRRLGGKNPNSMAQTLAHHFEGGARIRKALEYALTQRGMMTADEFVAPGAAAKLDQYGNMSRGQLNQIMSQLMGFQTISGSSGVGYDNKPTDSARSKRNVKRAGVIFWSYGPNSKKTPVIDKASGFAYGYTGGGRSHLHKGAWARVGNTVKPLLMVINRASYSRRFDFQKVGEAAVASHFSTEFDTALQRVKETQR